MDVEVFLRLFDHLGPCISTVLIALYFITRHAWSDAARFKKLDERLREKDI